MDPSYISKIKKTSLAIKGAGDGVFSAKGVWHRQQEFRDYRLEAICDRHTVRFRLIREKSDNPIITKSILIESLGELSKKISKNNTVFYSMDEPVLMAIYYSTR